MRRIMQNLAGAVLVTAAAALAAGAAGAAPYRIVSDGPESVWVLDAASGELVWCQVRAPSGPKVLDLFGDVAEARPPTPRRALPECSGVLAAAESDSRAERARARFAYGADRRIGGYGEGYRYGAEGDLTPYLGDYSLEAAGGQITIVRPRYVDITVN